MITSPFLNFQSSSFLLLYSHLLPVASSNEKLVTLSFISIFISQSSFSSIVFNGIPALYMLNSLTFYIDKLNYQAIHQRPYQMTNDRLQVYPYCCVNPSFYSDLSNMGIPLFLKGFLTMRTIACFLVFLVCTFQLPLLVTTYFVVVFR